MIRNCKHVAALAFAVTDAKQLPAAGDPFDSVVANWIEAVTNLQEQAATAATPREYLEYAIDVDDRRGIPQFALHVWTTSTLKSGERSAPRPFDASNLAYSDVKCITPIDRTIGRLAQACGFFGPVQSLSPTIFNTLLECLMRTDRLRWRNAGGVVLRYEEIAEGQLAWHVGLDGRQRVHLDEIKSTVLLPASPLWYIDTDRGVAGPVGVKLPGELQRLIARSPPLSGEQAERVQLALRHIFSANGIDGPAAALSAHIVEDEPVAVLRLSVLQAPRGHSKNTNPPLPVAELLFAYGDDIITPQASERDIRTVRDGRLSIWPRRAPFESKAQLLLGQAGFSPVYWPYAQLVDKARIVLHYPYEGERKWIRFIAGTLPALRVQGWRVEIDADFPYELREPDEQWHVEVSEGESPQWFDLELGIDVEGERISLLPVLLEALASEGYGTASGIGAISARAEPFIGKLPGGGFVALAPERVGRVLSALVGLFADDSPPLRDGRARIAAVHAASLADSDGLAVQWTNAQSFAKFIRDVRNYDGRTVTLPKTFKAELRGYQHAGVAWLQTLREHRFGGVLADDMGLGKTVQLLAHLAIERAAKRLQSPALIVAPASVVPNWRAEIARFLPAAKVVSLTGADRAQRLPALDGADIALTTYALLARDIELLAARDWSIVVLDEAQAIKNAKAKVAVAASRLRGTQRLALTGTPIENHLEELRSIYHFAVPDLLGDRARFSRIFRTPIERNGDAARQAALATRIRPFFVRRTKEDVAQELPEKTETIARIELTGSQRDLYETVRLAMHRRVRDEVARKGLARSHIVFLDALLKLRQICCDPRLLNLPEARTVKESQKLDALLEMLDSLVEDGRRILLFSQFTSMLDLIKAELLERQIGFVELRGSTRDREAPVAAFQNGDVPIFLISLKAGGTGLNLTAADTVIHYDPWWNPAVERQATDRAHRIGQQKHVFVYKFITERTVEEHIMTLQQRKGDLAAGIFGDAAAAKLTFELSDVDLLLS
ncbi:MAG: DEAD/DEAH box helicase [Candidatus Eremiobacteraeota bacterium]|nr:DEAD/DEAH box helicase [Candidatus Eremiobacteraeota bacterium]